MTDVVHSGAEDAGPADPRTRAHLESLLRALPGLHAQGPTLLEWGATLAGVLDRGGRLLVAGNGGSAAEAQHLTSELVGKMSADRRPLSAIALNAETSSLTAISNDFGFAEVYARQVRAHGRPGDILLTLSTSGRSANLLAATAAAREVGMARWALTGPTPNPLAQRSDAYLWVASPDPQTVQELHLVCVHLLCAHVDAHLPRPAFAAAHAAAPREAVSPVVEVALEPETVPVVAGRAERGA